MAIYLNIDNNNSERVTIIEEKQKETMLYCAKIMWSDSDRKLSLSMVMATDTTNMTDGRTAKERISWRLSVALLLGSPSSDTNGKVVHFCKKTCMHLLIIYVTIYGMKNKISLERKRFFI